MQKNWVIYNNFKKIKLYLIFFHIINNKNFFLNLKVLITLIYFILQN